MHGSLFCKIRCCFKRLSALALLLQSNWNNTGLYIRPPSVLPNWFRAVLAPFAPSWLITVIDYLTGVPSLKVLWDELCCFNHILKQAVGGWRERRGLGGVRVQGALICQENGWCWPSTGLESNLETAAIRLWANRELHGQDSQPLTQKENGENKEARWSLEVTTYKTHVTHLGLLLLLTACSSCT